MRPPRRCLGCGRLTYAGSRCPDCRNELRSRYTGTWPAESRARIAAHIRAHGHTCPGWERPAHPSTDLTVDHEVGVLCRSCNVTKKNRGGG